MIPMRESIQGMLGNGYYSTWFETLHIRSKGGMIADIEL
jgi:hypothetical protein